MGCSLQKTMFNSDGNVVDGQFVFLIIEQHFLMSIITLKYYNISLTYDLVSAVVNRL